MTDDEIKERIETVIQGPAAASSDAGSVNQQDPLTLLEVRRQLVAGTGAAKKQRGLRFTKLVAPGAV